MKTRASGRSWETSLKISRTRTQILMHIDFSVTITITNINNRFIRTSRFAPVAGQRKLKKTTHCKKNSTNYTISHSLWNVSLLLSPSRAFEYMRKNKDDDEDDANEQRLSNSLGARTMWVWVCVLGRIKYRGGKFLPPNVAHFVCFCSMMHAFKKIASRAKARIRRRSMLS